MTEGQIPQPLIQSVKALGEQKDLQSLQYLQRFVNREIDKLTIMQASSNPHPTSHDEGHE